MNLCVRNSVAILEFCYLRLNVKTVVFSGVYAVLMYKVGVTSLYYFRKIMEVLKTIFTIWLVVLFGFVFLGLMANLVVDPKGFYRELYYRMRLLKLVRRYQEVLHNREYAKLRKRNVSLAKQPSTVIRSVWVVVVSIATVGVGYFILDCIGQPNGCGGLSALEIDKLDVKVVSTAAMLLISAPIGFLIWLYRDINKLKEIEQQRKDTNLKEFQKLQEWATGNILDNSYEEVSSDNTTVRKVKDEAIALQISALHSLRGYLKGEYGDSFKRGAFEVFASVLRIQHKKIIDRLDPEGSDKFLTSSEISNEINQDELTKQINRIVIEDWFSFFLDHDFSTHNLSLVGMSLPMDNFLHKTFGRSLSFVSCDFRGACLRGWFQGVNFSNSDFRGAILNLGDFTGCSFSCSNLRGAILASSMFQGASFSRANLQGVNAQGSHFEGVEFAKADLRGSDLSEAKFYGAIFDDADLIGANLNNAQLQASCLINTKLAGANIEGANFSGAISKDFEGRIYNERFKKVILNSVGKKAELSGVSMRISFDDALVSVPILESIDREIWDKKRNYNNWNEKWGASRVSESTFAEQGTLDCTYSQKEAEVWLSDYCKAIKKAKNGGCIKRNCD